MIKQNGNYLFDKFNDQTILIYTSPTTSTPTAIYIDEVTPVSFVDKKLSFQNGEYLLNGSLYSIHDKILNFDSPNHIFSRWYGFVATFAKCDIETDANNA